MSEAAILALIGAGAGIFGAALGGVVSVFAANRQFRASVLSGNRQAWINTVRDTVAEILSSAPAIIGQYNEGTALETLTQRAERLYFLQMKLDLLLNPAEQDHRDLIRHVASYVYKMLEPIARDGGVTLGIEAAKGIDTQVEAKGIKDVTQRILKTEWQRVKAGN